MMLISSSHELFLQIYFELKWW